MPSGNKSLPEPVLTQIYVIIWQGHNKIKFNVVFIVCSLSTCMYWIAWAITRSNFLYTGYTIFNCCLKRYRLLLDTRIHSKAYFMVLLQIIYIFVPFRELYGTWPVHESWGGQGVGSAWHCLGTPAYAGRHYGRGCIIVLDKWINILKFVENVFQNFERIYSVQYIPQNMHSLFWLYFVLIILVA